MIEVDPHDRRLAQRGQSIQTILIVVLVIFLIQLWLVNIAVEEFLAERTAYAVPTFLASGACFAINLWLLKALYDVDRGEEST